MEYIGKFIRDYLTNGDRQDKHYHLTLAYAKGQGKGHTHFDCDYFKKL